MSGGLASFDGWTPDDLPDHAQQAWEGDTEEAFATTLTVPDFLLGAEESLLEERHAVNAESVLSKASQSAAYLVVKEADSVLEESQETVINGNVATDDGDVLKNAQSSGLKGDVEAYALLHGAEESAVQGDIRATHVLPDAERSASVGDHTVGALLADAMDSYVKGDVHARHYALIGSERSMVRGEVTSRYSVLEEAEASVIAGEAVHAYDIGTDSYGSLIVAEEVTADNLSDELNIVSDADLGASYEGDWDELYDVVEEAWHDGQLECLELFGAEAIPDDTTYSDAEGFRSEIEDLASMYEEVKPAKEFHDTWEQFLPLPDLDTQSKEEKVDYLDNIVDEMESAIQTKFDISEDAARSVLTSNINGYLIQEMEGYEEDDIVQDASEFLETHSAVDEELVVNPRYSRTYSIGPGTGDTAEHAEEHAYKQGSDLLETFKHDPPRNLVIADEETRRARDRLQAEVERLGRAIDEAYQQGDQTAAEHLKEKKREKKDALIDYEGEYVETFLEDHGFTGDDASQDELADALDKVASDILKENSNAWNKATRYRDEIRNDKTYVEVATWDKTIADVPKRDTYSACVLPEEHSNTRGGWLEYMQDPHTQLLTVDVDDRAGLAIGVEAEQGEDQYFVVNGVESESNVFKRSDVTQTTVQGIEDWAEEAGYDGVIYNDDPNNTAPTQFVENLEADEGYEHIEMELEKPGASVPEEIGFPDVSGYRRS